MPEGLPTLVEPIHHAGLVDLRVPWAWSCLTESCVAVAPPSVRPPSCLRIFPLALDVWI